MTRIREISLRCHDPAALAELLAERLGLTRLRHDAEAQIEMLTDGYIQIGLRRTEPGDGPSPVDHLGIEVDDLAEACGSLLDDGWTEAANSVPATRFLDGPDRFQLEVREQGWGWDDVIRSSTQLYKLAPAPGDPPAVGLPDVDGTDPDRIDADGLVRVASVGDLPVAGAARVLVSGRPVLLVDHEATFHAVEDACPHMPRIGRVSEGQRQGPILECPIHRSRFDVRTGAVVGDGAPARDDLRIREARVHDGAIWVGGPVER